MPPQPLSPLSKGPYTEDTFTNAIAYRKLVGKLNYVTNTRPDIAFLVQYLSQFLQAPTKSHMTTALYTLPYIKKDPSQGLFFNNMSDYILEAYCHFDWAQYPWNRRSVSGYFIMLGGGPISWKSNKQPIVTLLCAKMNIGQ